jgi:Ca2+-binding RTX toxin-like protein
MVTKIIDRSPTLHGFPHGVDIDGTDGDETLSGTFLNDTINGNGGNDQLFGHGGNDVLNGGAGNDYLVGGAGADQLIGGDGFDVASYADATLGVTVDLATGFGTNDAAGDTFSSIEKIVGSSFDDIISGDAGNNNFDGGDGNDWLFGQAGDDTLKGGKGDDHIVGGDGNDYIVGGGGNDVLTGDSAGTHGFDTFVISAQQDATVTITDFDYHTDTLSYAGFGDKPYGDDGALAWGWHDDHLDQWVTYNLDGSDKLFYDVGSGKLVDMNANLAHAMLDHAAIGPNAFHAEVIFSNYAALSNDFTVVTPPWLDLGQVQAGHNLLFA